MNMLCVSAFILIVFCGCHVQGIPNGAQITPADAVDRQHEFEAALPRTVKASLIAPAMPHRAREPTRPFPGATTGNVLAVARQNSATKFADLALKTSWLSSTLSSGSGDVTLFAFSDDAYNGCSAAVKAALATEGERDRILQYHVALGAHYSKEIAIRGRDTLLYSLYPSPPFEATSQYQPIHVDSYLVTFEEVVTASGAPVVKTDLMASNGVVHILDKVIYPVPTGADMARALQEEPKYSSLYAALKKANLTAALSTPAFQPLTLLAPNNAAFAKLTKAQQQLLQNATILQKVLTYHVGKNCYYSAAVYENFQLRSLEGSTIYFEKGAGGVSAEGQMLVNFDWTVTNGVVHELDGVMFPRNLRRLFGADGA